MIRISKILLAITIVLLALWQLPWCYAFFNANSDSVPFTLYSGIHGDFISIKTDANKNIIGVTPDGQEFSREQADSLLPFFYVRQLVTDGRLPDTIQGYPVTPRDIQMSNFMFRSSPSDLNKPVVALYPLLESLSKRVELEMSEDVFRISNEGIEFIKMEGNTINTAKSETFTKALIGKGFVFPSRHIAGNPTVKKDYDEGYLIVDNEGKLFHMKKVKERPYVRYIELPDSIEIKHLFLNEFKDKKTLAFIVDKSNRLYVLSSKTYQLTDTGITDCDLNQYNLTIIGNMADWTVWLAKDDCCEYYALDANTHSIVKHMTKDLETPSFFGLHFTSGKDKYVYPRF